MPMELVDIHMEQMRRIRARESLLAATISAIGGGRVKNQSSILAGWRRLAQEPGQKRAHSKEEIQVRLASMGIKVVRQ